MRHGRSIAAGGVFVLAIVFAVIRPRGIDASSGGGGRSPEPAAPQAKSAGGGGGIGFFSGAVGPQVDVIEATRGRMAETVTAPGTIRPGSEVAIGAPFEGRVLELAVDEGAPVKEGDLVFRLDPVEWQQKLREAEIDLVRKKAAFDEAEAEEKDAARKAADLEHEPSATVEARLKTRQAVLGESRAQAQLDSAIARLNLAKAKLERNIGSKVDVDAAETESNVSQIQRKIAEEELVLARAAEGFRERTWKEDRTGADVTLGVARTKLARAREDVRQGDVSHERAKRDLDRTWIRTPLAGVVTLRNVNQGELVTRGDGRTAESTHYIVSDMKHMLVYADVEEGDVTKVAPEQPARVRVNALGDDVRLRGRVIDVANRAGRKDDVATFRVRVLIDNDDGGAGGRSPPRNEECAKHRERLRPSMTASVEIETRSKEEAIGVPLPAVVQRKRKDLPDEAWSALDAKAREAKRPDDPQDVVFVVRDGKAELRAVVVGISDGERVEIEKGIAPTDHVIAGPYRTLESLRSGDVVRPNAVKVEKKSQDAAPNAAKAETK